MVVAPIAASWDREQVMDFISTAMYAEETKVMLKIYGQDDSTLKLFAKPFKSYVWTCIGVSIVLGTVATCAFNAWSMVLERQTTNNNVNQLGKLPNALWFAIGAIVNQGGCKFRSVCNSYEYGVFSNIHIPMHRHASSQKSHYKCISFVGSVYIPKHHSGRVFMSAWWLYCIILGAVYTGNLIAFISVVKIKYPFYTLDEMVEQNQYTFGTLGGTNQELSLKVNINQQLWQSLKKRTGALSIKVKDFGDIVW